jgi:hypothetical protein
VEGSLNVIIQRDYTGKQHRLRGDLLTSAPGEDAIYDTLVHALDRMAGAA